MRLGHKQSHTRMLSRICNYPQNEERRRQIRSTSASIHLCPSIVSLEVSTIVSVCECVLPIPFRIAVSYSSRSVWTRAHKHERPADGVPESDVPRELADAEERHGRRGVDKRLVIYSRGLLKEQEDISV